jgi:hypothetical protein
MKKQVKKLRPHSLGGRNKTLTVKKSKGLIDSGLVSFFNYPLPQNQEEKPEEPICTGMGVDPELQVSFTSDEIYSDGSYVYYNVNAA